MQDGKTFLGTQPIKKLLPKLAVPTVIAQLVNMLYNIVDRIYIGHIPEVGSLALTGIGVCMPLILIVSAFSAFVASGGAPRASIFMGRGDCDSAERTLGGCLTMQVIISLLLTAAMLIWKDELLYLFGASENTIYYAADDGKSQFLEFVNVVSSAENISFSAKVSAQYSDKTAQFTLGYEQTADGASVSVIEPEMLRGIKANVAGKNLSLEYDGAILDIGTLDDAELSPMSSLPLIVQAMRNGHLEISWVEDDMLAARIIPADDYVVTLWIDSSLTPRSAEISYKENTVVLVEISDWTVSP